MKRKQREYPMGSVSSGTMREADLIPAFVDALEEQIKQTPRWRQNKVHKQMVRVIRQSMKDEAYFQSDAACYDNEGLFIALDDYSAPYFYFGSLLGGDADYGWWLSEDFEADFDGSPRYQDLSEVPKDFEGELAIVNDHGNVSLYHKARTQPPRLIWSLV